jgi:hypothetical protein
LSEDERQAQIRACSRQKTAATISAFTGDGIDELLLKIQYALAEKAQQYIIQLPSDAGALLAWCYRQGVIENREDTDDGCLLTLNLNEGQLLFVQKHDVTFMEGAIDEAAPVIEPYTTTNLQDPPTTDNGAQSNGAQASAATSHDLQTESSYGI